MTRRCARCFERNGRNTTEKMPESKNYGEHLLSGARKEGSYQSFESFEYQYHNWRAVENEETGEEKN